MSRRHPDDDNQSFGDLLAEEGLVIDVLEDLLQAMEHQGISQAELARRMGVTRSAVNRIFRGSNLTVRTVARLGRAAGVKVRFSVEAGEDPEEVEGEE